MELNCLLSKTLGNLGRGSTCTSIMHTGYELFLLTIYIYIYICRPYVVFCFFKKKKLLKEIVLFLFLNGAVVAVNCNF